jgi:hypothetical protein
MQIVEVCVVKVQRTKEMWGNGVACSKKAVQCAATHHCRYMPIIEQFSWAIFAHSPP